MFGRHILAGDHILSNVSGRPVTVIDVVGPTSWKGWDVIELAVQNRHGVRLSMFVGEGEMVRPVGDFVG